MEKNKVKNKIKVQALKIARGKQKVLKQSGLPVTSAVKAEIMKAVMAEARKATKNIPMVDGKIGVTAEAFVIVKNTGKKFANTYTAS